MNVPGTLVLVAGLFSATAVSAGPVVREAAGANAAAIQAAVDLFRADLGGPNNGTTAGTQPAGRREINWDGGGAGASVTLDPSPMTRFAARGATFLTAGSGFEISGQPAPLLGELHAGYAGLFAAFSAPRIFTPLDANTMDVVFHVPGNAAVAAAVSGFGAIFTNVDLAGATSLRFFAPDGTLLYERAVPAATGDATLSFVGVSFDAGEVVARVHLVTGNVAMGLAEKPGGNVVALDDFLYAEPVATAGLVVTPGSTSLFRTGGFDLVIGLAAAAGTPTGGRILFDGADVTSYLAGCLRAGTLAAGGVTAQCAIPRGLLTPGDHVLQVVITLADQTSRRTAARWTVIGNSEP